MIPGAGGRRDVTRRALSHLFIHFIIMTLNTRLQNTPYLQNMTSSFSCPFCISNISPCRKLNWKLKTLNEKLHQIPYIYIFCFHLVFFSLLPVPPRPLLRTFSILSHRFLVCKQQQKIDKEPREYIVQPKQAKQLKH